MDHAGFGERFAAVDIAYEEGEDVIEQAASMTKEFKLSRLDADEREEFDRLQKMDGHFDLLHWITRPETIRSTIRMMNARSQAWRCCSSWYQVLELTHRSESASTPPGIVL